MPWEKARVLAIRTVVGKNIAFENIQVRELLTPKGPGT